ncbi:MAG: ribose 5-phosphate isomerase A [Thermoplasmata archaeon]
MHALAKENAAKEALKYVSDGMVVGIGSGSTVNILINLLSSYVKNNNLDISVVGASKESERNILKANLKLVEMENVSYTDVTIDGADAIDGNLCLIKGGGGALFREKIIAKCARKVIIIADYSKLYKKLEEYNILPIEVVHFSRSYVERKLKEMNIEYKIRSREEKLFISDNGNYIFDIAIGKHSIALLEKELRSITGVVETGYFEKIATMSIIGYEDHVDTLTTQ